MTSRADLTPRERAEATVFKCKLAASRMLVRLEAMVERDGSEQAAVTGRGIGIGYLLAKEVTAALTEAAETITSALAAERAAFERAAQEAMKHFHPDESTSTWLLACETIAEAIRALASSGDGKEAKSAP